MVSYLALYPASSAPLSQRPGTRLMIQSLLFYWKQILPEFYSLTIIAQTGLL